MPTSPLAVQVLATIWTLLAELARTAVKAQPEIRFCGDDHAVRAEDVDAVAVLPGASGLGGDALDPVAGDDRPVRRPAVQR